MKTETSQLTVERAKLNITTFWLVKIGSFYYTDCPVEIPYGGNTYSPFGMELSGFKSSDGNPLEGGTIRLTNVMGDLSSAILNNTIKNADVYVYEAWFDGNMLMIGADLICAGKVTGRPGFNEQWADIKVAGHLNPWSQRFPTRRITRADYPFIPARGRRFAWGSEIIVIK